ncbi:MAG TPA: sulfurtransferase [Pyrinomonadaceae bacterium]|nr:sulfurtransferase [Pyrinomonadaceae bacterium]
MKYSHRIGLLSGVLLGIASVLFFLLPLRVDGQGTANQKGKPTSPRSKMVVSTDWLAAHLNDPKVVVLHVARERGHFDEAHIPGARFVGWGEITATRDGVPNELAPVADLQKVFERLGIGNDARIVVYGDNSGLAAARAYFTLDYLGHGDRVAFLDGGLEKWKAERRTTSTDKVEPKTARFTPQVRASAVTNLDVVRDFSWTATNVTSPNAVLIDARPVAEYTGANPGDGVPRGGHIPGAVNVFWMQNVQSKENPVLRSVAELRKLYEEAGALPGRTLVTYCRTGGQASHSYFTLKYLGYDVVMYDGSFFEWSNTEGTPIIAGQER